MEGLTVDEVEFAATILAGLLPGAEVENGKTDEGSRYVVATRHEPDGELTTRTVCRERGRVAVLGTDGDVVG